MDAAAASRAKFQDLLDRFYKKCEKCGEEREEQLIVLPCVHVVCTGCVQTAIRQATRATTLPRKSQPTNYHDHRRFECPVCAWPQYQPYGSDDFASYPGKLPLHAELIAMGDNPLQPAPSVIFSTTDDKTLPHSFETRQSSYIFESVIGEFGPDCEKGQMRRVTGLAVDERDPADPLVVVCESKTNYILTFHLLGNLERARDAKLRVWDICIAEMGTVVASVAEQEAFALAKWDSAVAFRGGVRHENLFRDIYGHGAQIKSEPFGVTRDSRGRFMVTMLAKDRVCRWDERKTGDHIYWFGGSGLGAMQFNGPYYIAKMSNDLSVVSSTLDHKVKVIDDEREQLVKEIGGLGCDLPDLCFPHGVCVDSKDNIYIADTGNFRVVAYDKDGGFLGCLVSETWNYGLDVKPTNVAVLQDRRLLVAMQGRSYCSIHVYMVRREEADDDCDCSCSLIQCFTSLFCLSHKGYEPIA